MKMLILLILFLISVPVRGLSFEKPDPALTPGEAHLVPLKTLCKPGYSSTVRNVSKATKKRICVLYHKKDQCPRGYEIDHLTSLELGGLNTDKNLWPEPWGEARKKDLVENDLHQRVCKKELSLIAAQNIVTHSWDTYYEELVSRGRH